MKMKLFLISQAPVSLNDCFDSAVVCAVDEEAARNTNPDGTNNSPFDKPFWCGQWCRSPDKVTVKYLGEAAEGVGAGVVCASFNAP